MDLDFVKEESLRSFVDAPVEFAHLQYFVFIENCTEWKLECVKLNVARRAVLNIREYQEFLFLAIHFQFN